VDTRFQKAVKLLLKHPTLKVPEAMKLADFSCKEQDVHAKRMIIYRQLTKISTHINNAFLMPPPQSSVVVGMGSSHSGNDWGTLSSVTLLSSSSLPAAPPAVLKKARLTVTAAQLCQVEAGRELALRERELMAAADAMNREKRAALRQKLDEIDAEEALKALMSVNGEEPAHATPASEAV
jgi:hypothetical protein